MAAAPQMPDHPLTIAEYAALGEVESGFTELVEGTIVMSPGPIPRHIRASRELANQLDPQLPDHLEVLQELDVDLEFMAPDEPGSSRRPDLAVVLRSAAERVDDKGGMVGASEVLIAIEIVSPSSRRTDNVFKRIEYADAEIPHYWIIDLREPISVVACHLAGELGYQDPGDQTEIFTTTEPFELTIDLNRLGRPGR